MSDPEPDTLAESPASPDPELFYELVSTRTLREHHISPLDSPSTPRYCIKKYETITKKKPDVVIHGGDNKSGPVLGVVRLGLREHTIGLGDPDALIEEGNVGERVIWERMRRTNRWNYKSYEFDFESGRSGGERTTYTWKWTNRGMLGMARDMELRAGSPGDEQGELVAVYSRTTWKNVKRGTFSISRKFGGDGDERGKKWELVVLLTALGILELATRR